MDDALERMRKFCVYQERAHSEVRSKLLKLKVYGDDLEEIMSQLISEDFLNEERFAIAYASGKFRINRWGKHKIKMYLKQKGVSEYNIGRGLSEIDDAEYLATIDAELTKKLRGSTEFVQVQKVRAYLFRKGYESELVSQRIARMNDEQP